jgi:hypothetical protein
MTYTIHDTKLHHDGGAHNLEVEVDGEQAVLRFGASFTLRMTETQIDELRNILYDASRELSINQGNRLYAERLAEVEAARDSRLNLAQCSEV